MSESTLEICQRERLLRLDAHIRFEFELTAQRMTYLAIVESFLFSTFILALANSSSSSSSSNTGDLDGTMVWNVARHHRTCFCHWFHLIDPEITQREIHS